METIIVVDYDPIWPDVFRELSSRVWPLVADFALSIEHVGSTAVPGLAAKPVIDMTIVIPSEAQIPLAIRQLAKLGYVHRGNLGVEGREAFQSPEGFAPHHLYVCPQGSLGLQNQLAVRDYLRNYSGTAQAYGELKKDLARQFPHDIDSYIDGRTDFLLGVLRDAGLSSDQLQTIEHANQRK